MNKLATTLALTALFGVAAQADITRLEAGIGLWQSDPSGTITSTSDEEVDTATALNYETENINYIWLLFKHPLPAIPNVRLEYTDLSHSGSLDSTVTWNGHTYDTSGDSELGLKQADLALYYNLLDNTFWTTLDVGLDFKYVDASFTIADDTDSFEASEMLLIPMGYLRARAQIPMTGLAFEGDIKYVAYGDSSYYDARIKADYTFDITPVIQPALEVGYRVQKLEIDEDGFDVATDVEFSGVYVGLMARF
jgi:outer membrane protein